MNTSLIVAAFAGAALYGTLSAVLPERIRLARINQREAMDLSAMYREYFSDSTMSLETFQELWKDAARALGLPPDKLRPSDRFRTELSVAAFPFVDLNEDLDELLRRRPENSGLSGCSIRLETLRDFVLELAAIDRSALPRIPR